MTLIRFRGHRLTWLSRSRLRAGRRDSAPRLGRFNNPPRSADRFRPDRWLFQVTMYERRSRTSGAVQRTSIGRRPAGRHHDRDEERIVVGGHELDAVWPSSEIQMVVVATELVDDANEPPIDVDQCTPRLHIELQPARWPAIARRQCRRREECLIKAARRPPVRIEEHQPKPRRTNRKHSVRRHGRRRNDCR